MVSTVGCSMSFSCTTALLEHMKGFLAYSQDKISEYAKIGQSFYKKAVLVPGPKQ